MIQDNDNTNIENESTARNDIKCDANGNEQVPKPIKAKILADLRLTVTENNSLLNDIKEAIQNRLEYDAVKEKAFKKLYDDMKRERELSEIIDRNIKPILTDLLLLYDNMKEFEALLIKQQSPNNEVILKNFDFILNDLLEILYRQDVELIAADDSRKFDSKSQKAIKIEKTENQADDFNIVDFFRQGFSWREKILRPQEVVIYRFDDNR